jgi:acyl-CoA thioesterase
VVTSEIDGPQTTQARVTIALGDTDVISASASLGVRNFPVGGRWLEPPDVAGVADSSPVATPPGVASILDHYGVRLSGGRARQELDGIPGSGRRAIWCRIPGGRRPVTAADVAIAGDLVVLALPDAIGVPCSANSLDNTIRMATRAPSEWLLVDANVDAVIGGYAHAHANIWTDDGVLLGLASQTLVLRAVDDDGRSIRTNRRIVSG